MEVQYVAKGHMRLSSVSRHAVNAGRKPTDRDLPLEYDELRIPRSGGGRPIERLR